MSFFGSILSKLGIGGGEETPKAEPSRMPSQSAPNVAEPRTPNLDEPPATRAISSVDVVALLDGKPNSKTLNWRTSIVDLLKLLELESSVAARKTLGEELGCPPELADGSSEKNIWLHKAVMKKLAENGGNIPPELLK